MIFLFLGGAAAIFGCMGVSFAIAGDKENLKKYVGTENRGMAAVLGFVGIGIGAALCCWMFF